MLIAPCSSRDGAGRNPTGPAQAVPELGWDALEEGRGLWGCTGLWCIGHWVSQTGHSSEQLRGEPGEPGRS